MGILNKLILYISSFVLTITPMQKYVEGMLGQPTTFLPGQAITQSDKTISRLIYRGLFKYDIYGVLIPDLADTWSISEDGLTYTVKLKDNQYWSNNKKITSDDLIYTSYKTPNLLGVATDKIDDLTVQYTLPNKFSPFLDLLTIGIMPSGSVEDGNFLHPISSGSFKVISVERSGPLVTSVILINNNEEEKIRKLIFRYYANETELVTAAKLGEVEGFLSKNNQELENFTEYKFPEQGVYYALFFNLRNEKLKEAEFRKKLEKVLSIKDLTYREGIVVQGPISRSAHSNRELDFEPYDSKFKDVIKDMILTITVPNIPEHVELAKEIKNIWRDKLDIDVNIQKVNADEIADKVIKNRNFEVLLYGQETDRDPDRYVYWHSTQSDYPGLNITGFSHVRADRALESGREVVDNEKRLIHYNEFQKVIVDQVPAIFLYHPFAKYYVSKYISGIGDKYTFNSGDRFLDFDNWSKITTN